jgi:hypothetical protein
MRQTRTLLPRLLIIIVFLWACSHNKSKTLKPQGYESENVLTVESGDLKAVFVDNSEIAPDHRAGYNGIAQLYHAQQDSGIFVPAYAGFNLEHIFGGDTLAQLFEPRLHGMQLYRKSEHEVLLYQAPTPISSVESLTSFKVVNPHYIDVNFECILHNTAFFSHHYAGLFWASYIANPPDKRIYFQGSSEKGSDSIRWIAAWSGKHGDSSTHKSVNDNHDFYFADNFNARLASHFSTYRYTEPYFFGRYKGMVLAFLLDGGREVIRFSQSPDGGGKLNPAWDFQYLIPSPEPRKIYSFKARIIYKPFVSDNDIAEEYRRWKGNK